MIFHVSINNNIFFTKFKIFLIFNIFESQNISIILKFGINLAIYYYYKKNLKITIFLKIQIFK